MHTSCCHALEQQTPSFLNSASNVDVQGTKSTPADQKGGFHNLRLEGGRSAIFGYTGFAQHFLHSGHDHWCFDSLSAP